MKMLKYLLASLILSLTLCNESAKAAAILVDDFESYFSTAEMDLVWNDGPLGNGTLDQSLGNLGQSLFHPGGTTQNRSFNPTIASDSNPIIWEFDMYDDGALNKRNTGSLRDNGSGSPLTAILEMGRYNAAANPEVGNFVDGYAIRTVFLGGDDWLVFPGNPAVQAGWHTFRATIGSTNITWELDLMADGSVDAMRETLLTQGSNRAYNVARFGGPSNVSSPGGAVNFDNLTIAQASPITYQGVLSDGITEFDSVSNNGTVSDPDNARYWTFFGNQGDVVRIDGLRQELDLDPALWIFEGVFSDTSEFSGGSSVGFDSQDPGFLNFADDELPSDGPFGDPRAFTTLTLPGTGQYTVAIVNFTNSSNDGGDGRFDYSITLLNVPEPTTVSLLGFVAAAAILFRIPQTE